MGGLPQEGILNLKNKSHSITAEIVVPEASAEGVIVNQGGFSGGWVVYLKLELILNRADKMPQSRNIDLHPILSRCVLTRAECCDPVLARMTEEQHA
jgi:hypothetical protein